MYKQFNYSVIEIIDVTNCNLKIETNFSFGNKIRLIMIDNELATTQ